MPRISAMVPATSPSRLVVSKILEIHGEFDSSNRKGGAKLDGRVV